jgi:hypothetical protein
MPDAKVTLTCCILGIHTLQPCSKLLTWLVYCGAPVLTAYDIAVVSCPACTVLYCAVLCWVAPLLCVHSALRSILQRLSQNGLLARFVIDEV